MGRRQLEERRRSPMWGSSGKRRRSWATTLLAAAVLSSGFLLAQAQEITISVIPEPSQPLKGQDVTLTPAGKPDFLVCSWYRGGENEPNRIFRYIPSSHEQQNGTSFTGRETAGPGCSLHIRNLMLNDTGDYIVSKIVSGGRETGRVHIRVLEKLFPPILWPADLFVKEHTDVTLNCNTSESSGVDVFWFKDGNPILAKPLLSERNQTLNIPDVSRDDAGTYTCQVWKLANNATSNPSKIAVTERLFPPLLWPAELFVDEHVDVTLNCTTSERSEVTISWFKDRKALPAKVVLSEQNRALTIPDVSRDDEGMYTCEARNQVYSAMSNPSKIAVTEKLLPPILWPAEIFVEEHADVTLNCTTSEHSEVTISWFKDGKAVPAKVVLSERNRALTVPDVSRDDEGMYTCQAWNRANNAMSNPSKIAVTQPHSTLAAGAVSAIVLGPLAVAALAGMLLYCFFRARGQKNKSSKQMNPTPPVYENTGPSAQVVPVNSSEINNTYEELQHGSQAVYDQLRW